MCSTLVGGYFAARSKGSTHLLMGFGAGVLLGAVFFDLLPESLAVAAQQGWSTRVVLAIVIGAFIFFYLIERFLVLHVHADDCDVESHRHLGRLTAIGLIAHSTLDGAAIGAASLVNWQTALMVAAAIIVHDASDGLNTILLVTQGERPRRLDILFLILDALAPVVGVLLALVILPPVGILAIVLAIASGLFLYIATSDLLPEAHRRSPSIGVATATVTGIALIGIAVQLIGG